MLAFMIILIVLVMITATTGPVFVIASMGGDEAVPFGKVKLIPSSISNVPEAALLAQDMDLSQMLDLMKLPQGAIQYFRAINKTVSLQEAILFYQNLNLTIPVIDNSVLSSLMTNINRSKPISLDFVTNFLDLLTMKGSCKAPFVPYQKQYCAPSCPADDIAAGPRSVTAYMTFSYISMATQYICSLLMFYTWIRVKELRSSSHLVSNVMVLFYFVSGNRMSL
jgi:hypothetical protein